MSGSSQKKPFTAAEGRHFGLAVGAVLLAVAFVSALRNRSLAFVAVLGGLGAILLLAGLLMPGRLGPFYRGWMAIAVVLSRITTPVILAVMYFLMITPMAFLRRTFGGNPLVARDSGNSFWVIRGSPRSRSMWRQF
ncbi:MAG TPA: SxtJ family membrane protein [Gemmatimonadaceae bacterium]